MAKTYFRDGVPTSAFQDEARRDHFDPFWVQNRSLSLKRDTLDCLESLRVQDF